MFSTLSFTLPMKLLADALQSQQWHSPGFLRTLGYAEGPAAHAQAPATERIYVATR